MKRRARLLLCILFGISLAGCQTETSDDPEPEEPAVIEYMTMPPPADGWTTAELMSVTYFCDHRLSYPLSMDRLGEDFSLSGYSRFGSKWHLVPGRLQFKGQSFANVTVVKPHDEMMIYNIVTFPEVCQVEDVVPFVINGVKMYDSYEDVLAALGEGYQYKSENSLMYNDRETNESLYSLFFDEEGRLDHINVDFRFDIDLPLYQRNNR